MPQIDELSAMINPKQQPNPYSAVIITARTPYATYTSTKIMLDKKSVQMVEDILTNCHSQLQIKLPIADDEVVVLPTELLQMTAFTIRYIP